MNDGCYYLYNPSVFAPFSSTSTSVTDIDFDFDGKRSVTSKRTKNLLSSLLPTTSLASLLYDTIRMKMEYFTTCIAAEFM